MRSFARFHRRLTGDAFQGGAIRASLLAIGSGALMACGKTAAAVLTGSASMLADAVQSWIGTVTEIFLMSAYLVARRPPDGLHPFGYGRESYVWSLLASIGMFVVGAEVGVWRGFARLNTPDIPINYHIGYLVIAGSAVLQAMSLIQALSFARNRARVRDRGLWAHVYETSDAQLRSVVADDLIALIGLVVAALGMTLHEWTGDVRYDAFGSVLIGVLMAVAGIFMIDVNRRLLAGAAPPANQRRNALARLLSAPQVARVTMLFLEFVGPDQVMLAARVELTGEHSQAELGRMLRALEGEIMQHPNVVRASLSLSSPDEATLQ